ncbi:MAG: MFS transporter [Alloprevotella sp.]|nr:MFS transporter [Alloprevotella sp.]
MQKVSQRVTATILSMSLLTVMAGAAIAPALGIIRAHFQASSPLLVQLIVSLPALLIILTSLFFLPISRRFSTRTIAVVGLLLYVAAGSGCFFAEHVETLLMLRAVLGISVGLIMPLSTGLLAYYFPPEAQARLMGLSAAMNQLGGVVATLLAGLLAEISWNDAFLVYLLGLIAVVMVWAWLPDAHLRSENKRGKAFEPKQLLKFHPSVVGMWLVMMIFFVFPTNFALSSPQTTTLSTTGITLAMVGLDLVAFFVGLCFGQLMTLCRRGVKYFAPLCFFAGYGLFVVGGTWPTFVGTAFVGCAVGVGVPYLNTIASIKGGRNSATTVMPLLSAALYLGQFLSPLVVVPLSAWLFGAADIVAPYKVACLFSLLLLGQTYATRHYQSLPPLR